MTVSLTARLNLYRCHCAAGFVSQHCEVDYDECASSPCLNSGVCAESGTHAADGSGTHTSYESQGIPPDMYACNCTDGWEGDNCADDIDECESAPCNNGASCYQTEEPGGFNCNCSAGWEQSAGTTCLGDIDECSSEPCENNFMCNASWPTVAPDSFACACMVGYEGNRCEMDIDECLSSPCIYNGSCMESNAHSTIAADAYSCNCTAGREGDNCADDADECVSSPCLHGGLCLDSHRARTIAFAACWQFDSWAEEVTNCGAQNEACWSESSASFEAFMECYQEPLGSIEDICWRHDEWADAAPACGAQNEDCWQASDTLGQFVACYSGPAQPDVEQQCWQYDTWAEELTKCGVHNEACWHASERFEDFEACYSMRPDGENYFMAIDEYSCRCVDGWQGANCGVDVDECHSDPCVHSNLCVESADRTCAAADVLSVSAEGIEEPTITDGDLSTFFVAPAPTRSVRQFMTVNFSQSCVLRGLTVHWQHMPFRIAVQTLSTTGAWMDDSGYEILSDRVHNWTQLTLTTTRVARVDADESVRLALLPQNTSQSIGVYEIQANLDDEVIPHADAYACVCTVGWEGHNCDQDVDECQSSPCLNDAGCASSSPLVPVDSYNCTCKSLQNPMPCIAGGLPLVAAC